MSFGLFLPKRWTRQPQGPVGVDWAHPLARRLGVIYVPSQGQRNLVNGQAAFQGRVPLKPGQRGMYAAHNLVAGQVLRFTNPFPSASGDSHTLFYSGRVTRDVNNETDLIGVQGPDIIANGRLRIETWSYGPDTILVYDYRYYTGASFAATAPFTENSIAVDASKDVSRVALVKRGNSNDRAFIYGREWASATTHNIYQTWAANSAFVIIGGSTTWTTGGETEIAAYWHRGMTDAEVVAISENPYQILRPRRPVLYSFPSGGATHELAGDATAGASAAGSLTTGIRLDGDASAGASASGDLTTGIPLAGDAAASAQASGTLSTEIRLAAAALVSATATGSLSTAINLAGSAAFASLADGTLTTQIRLAGDAIAGAVADAGLSTQILLDADAQAGADASGELTTVPSGLAGDAVAGATASGALSVQIILAGDAIASVLASGDLTTLGAGAALEGDATVLAIASGGLTTAIQLTGAPVISVTASGELSIGLGMTADALATVSASAVLSTQIRMEGAAVASALAAGSLSIGTAEHGARRASWRGAARQGWTRPASVQRASRPRQYG